jgi:hypothetical protein
MIISNGYRVIGGAVFLNRYTAPATGTANVIATVSSANVDEGNSLTVNISGSNIINSTYYWRIDSNPEDFTEFAGSFQIVNNVGSFAVSPIADNTILEGNELLSISIRLGSTTGTVVTTTTATVNDSSIGPSPYGSYYLDSSTAFIYIPNTNATDFAQRRFTTEFWIKYDANTAAVTGNPIAMAENNYYGVYILSTGTPIITRSSYTSYFYGFVGGDVGATIGANTVGYPVSSPNNWMHVALVGDGTTIRLYSNGNLYQLVASPIPINSTPALSPLQIWTPTGSNVKCFISDFRHVKNTVYLGNFTPPNKRLSRGGNASIYANTANVNTTFAEANTVVLLQRYSNTNPYIIIDDSANARSIYQFTASDTVQFSTRNSYIIGANTSPY